MEDFVRSRLAITVPVAHEKPPKVASIAASAVPLPELAAKISTSPMHATIAPNH